LVRIRSRALNPGTVGFDRVRSALKEHVVKTARTTRISLAATAVLGTALAVGVPAAASAATAPTAYPAHATIVYTLSNAASGNAVLAFRVLGHGDGPGDGALAPAGSFPTGGLGSGAGLGDQGALTVAEGGRVVLAVNAGSDSLTALRVADGGALVATSTVPSGGRVPVSVTVHGDLVYVLNAGDAANPVGSISGFRLSHGRLIPLAGSTRALSAGTSGAAQIGFTPNGRHLLVTEKGSNSLDTFTVDGRGLASAASPTASQAAVPFGFAFDGRGDAVVSDAAASAVTTYSLRGGVARQIAYVPDGGAAACWLVVSGRTGTAYVANAGTGTISTYDTRGGRLQLTQGVAATVGGHPTDEALGRGDVLYVRDATNNRLQAVYFGDRAGAKVVNALSAIPASAAGIAVVEG
jgi:6-phosphogluconolactonase